jgi:hypothetical protein
MSTLRGCKHGSEAGRAQVGAFLLIVLAGATILIV